MSKQFLWVWWRFNMQQFFISLSFLHFYSGENVVTMAVKLYLQLRWSSSKTKGTPDTVDVNPTTELNNQTMFAFPLILHIT